MQFIASELVEAAMVGCGVGTVQRIKLMKELEMMAFGSVLA
jgi:hypothetical protein